MQQRGALYAREYLFRAGAGVPRAGRVAGVNGRGRFAGGGAGEVHRSGVGEEFELFPAKDLLHQYLECSGLLSMVPAIAERKRTQPYGE